MFCDRLLAKMQCWELRSKERHDYSVCGRMCEWQVKLCDPSLTRAISERLRDESDSV